MTDSAMESLETLTNSPSSFSPQPADGLAARLAIEMGERWFAGGRPLAEEFLNRHPELWEKPEAAAQLVYEEICLRQEYIPGANPAEVIERFPQWQNQLRILLDCHRLLETSAPAGPVFPNLGETLGDFRILAELGRGAVGRVFLAAQLSLNDRQVVLKLSPCVDAKTRLDPSASKEPNLSRGAGREHQEHLSLARLQHTYIVPLYSSQDYPERNVRALCMPYFGGATLDRLLDKLRNKPLEKRTGRDLLAVLDQAQPASAERLPPRGPERQRLAEVSYVDALCILGLCLADALHYAHQRDLVHLDLKPANVLLAADGKPMLLDFHLAQPPIRSDGPPPRRLGGTPLYMSPEQEKALAAVRSQRPISAAVDGRSDIYSLGLLLYQALGGPLPVDLRAPSQLRRYNPEVSVGLADVLQKCMALEARDRYPNAAALAADLDRHLNHLPLRGVRNRSPSESLRKWRRRRPLALAGMSLVLLASIFAGSYVRNQVRDHYQRLEDARAELAHGQEFLRKGEANSALEVLDHGRKLAQSLLFSGALLEEIQEQMFLAEQALHKSKRNQAIERLHKLADQVRFRSLADSLSPAEHRELANRCQSLWQMRAEILQSGPANDPQEGSSIQSLKNDLRDLGIIWADLCLRLVSTDHQDNARQQALKVLDEVEKDFGPSPVLFEERHALAKALGRTDLADAAARRAAESPPHTAWEHYALGRAFLSRGNFPQAAIEFEKALDLEPQDFWPNFYQGLVAYRLKRPLDAVAAFRICVALRPDSAWCFYNRALAFTALGQNDQALKDYSRALQLDAGFAPAYLNRGILHFHKNRYGQAADDFRDALHYGADPATVHQNLDLVSKAQRQRRD